MVLLTHTPTKRSKPRLIADSRGKEGKREARRGLGACHEKDLTAHLHVNILWPESHVCLFENREDWDLFLVLNGYCIRATILVAKLILNG